MSNYQLLILKRLIAGEVLTAPLGGKYRWSESRESVSATTINSMRRRSLIRIESYDVAPKGSRRPVPRKAVQVNRILSWTDYERGHSASGPYLVSFDFIDRTWRCHFLNGDGRFTTSKPMDSMDHGKQLCQSHWESEAGIGKYLERVK